MSATWPFKTYGNPPVSLLRACARAKYAHMIDEVGNEGEDGYWIFTKPGFWNGEAGTISIHERTVADCINYLGYLEVDSRPEDKR